MQSAVRGRVLMLATCLICLAIGADALAQAQPASPAPAQAAPAISPPPAAAPAPSAYPPPPPAYPLPAGYPPPGAYPPPQYGPGPGYGYGYGYRNERPHRPRRSRGMLIGGIALFAASYVPPALIGVAVGTQDRDQCDCRDALRLLIPIVGPLTLWKPDRDLNFFFNTLMVVDSVMQIGGVVLTVFGILRYRDSVQESEYGQVKPRWSVGASPIPGGAYGSLRLQL